MMGRDADGQIGGDLTYASFDNGMLTGRKPMADMRGKHGYADDLIEVFGRLQIPRVMPTKVASLGLGLDVVE